jgi:hypothetical protein
MKKKNSLTGYETAVYRSSPESPSADEEGSRKASRPKRLKLKE